MKYRIFAPAGAALLLAACSSAPSVDQQVLAAQTAYGAAVVADITYASLPTANPVVLAKLRADRLAAYQLLEPVVLASECAPTAGVTCASPATTAELEALQLALSTFENDEAANNVTTGAK
jgi:hypothetical protein